MYTQPSENSEVRQRVVHSVGRQPTNTATNMGRLFRGTGILWNTSSNGTSSTGVNSSGSIAVTRVGPEPYIMEYLEGIIGPQHPMPVPTISTGINSNGTNSNRITSNSTGSKGINSNGSVVVARVGREPSIVEYLERIISPQHPVPVPSASPTPLAPSRTLTANSNNSIPRTDEELQALTAHWVEMEEMRHLQREDGGRQSAQQEQARKKKEEEERKDHAGRRTWRIVSNLLMSIMAVFTFLFTYVAVRAYKKGEQKKSRKQHGDEEQEVGERIELGLTRHWAAEENANVRDGPNITVVVAEPAETRDAKTYTARGASTDSASLDDEIQPVDMLALPPYTRNVEVVSRPEPTRGFLTVPERDSAENPWLPMEYRRESF